MLAHENGVRPSPSGGGHARTRRRGRGSLREGAKEGKEVERTKEQNAEHSTRDLLTRALTRTVEMMEGLQHCDEDAAAAVAALGKTAADIAAVIQMENSSANCFAKEP